MPEPNVHEAVETQVVLMVATVNNLCRSMERLTDEMRKTNESVQGLTSDQRVIKLEVERVSREIFTSDNSSRIRVCELHIRGLYGLLLFVAAAIAGELFAILSHWNLFLGGAIRR